jgi:thymidine phosphorylase
MDEPLGPTIGSGLEGLEARDFLRSGRGDPRLAALCARIGQALIVAGGGEGEAYARVLADGRAYEAFERLLAAQGADLRALGRLQPASPLIAARSPRTGFIEAVDAATLGECARELIANAGAFAGIRAVRRIGERIAAGEPLATVAGGDADMASRVASAFKFAEGPPAARPLVYAELEGVDSSEAARSTDATR